MKTYEEAVLDLQRQYLSVYKGPWTYTPMIVSIETYSKCNAACNFCPYVSLERIGQKLETDYVISLIDEISTFSPPPQRLNLSRVNEPFLDNRIFDFLGYAREKLPDTNLILFSNGQALTNNVIDRLNSINNFSLTVSFNEHMKEDYEEVMKISYDQTVKRLRTIHTRMSNGELNFKVTLSRVGTSDIRDNEFIKWCRKNFPLFPVYVSARFDWIGIVDTPVKVTPPDTGCVQWFSLHILADKTEAFCCIDGVGQKTSLEGKKLLDVYNDPYKKALREKITSRLNVEACKNCPHGLPSLYAI